MRCYLVRHAQTVWNGQNRFQGSTDSALSPLGREQAQNLATYFADRPISAIYHSGLQRTTQTAETIAQRLHITAAAEPKLAEIHLGKWEGLTPEEINLRFNNAYQIWRVQPSTLPVPEGEPLDAFRARVREGFAKIIMTHRSGELMLVSHGGVITSLLADWLGGNYDQMMHRLVLSNGGVSAIDYDATSRHILWVNATAHLTGEVISPVFPPATTPGRPRPDARME